MQMIIEYIKRRTTSYRGKISAKKKEAENILLMPYEKHFGWNVFDPDFKFKFAPSRYNELRCNYRKGGYHRIQVLQPTHQGKFQPINIKKLEDIKKLIVHIPENFRFL